MALDCYPDGAGSRTPCPTTVDDWVKAICATLPPGFAFEAAEAPGTLLSGRVRALAHLLQAFNEKACELLPEFVCDTASATLDLWDADYGIPDPCDINVLCLKVTANGDGTCFSLQQLTDAIALGFGPLEEFGMDLCCEAIPPEIQSGCWEMGCDQMAPKPVYEKGGSELGFAYLGVCAMPDCGSDLGQDTLGGSCNIVGYSECEDDLTPPDPPCEVEGCFRWQPLGNEMFTIGCPAPWDISGYVGTAYHLKVGISGSSAILLNPAWTQMGCFEMGCDQLCPPPVAQMLCFIERHRHAHIKILPVYC